MKHLNELRVSRFSLIGVALILLSIFIMSESQITWGKDTRQSGESPDGRPLPDLMTGIQVEDNAPGYCASSGGDTTYESIGKVDWTIETNNTMLLEIQISIENPNDCVPGEPCPSYDTYPEYVNAWIDFDKDYVWEESEKVLDQALTGYLSINYSGTMTAISQFFLPAGMTLDPTWMRVNLGWGDDPNDPCTLQWQWGDVYDEQLTLNPPVIHSIHATGVNIVDNQPQTGSPVRLQADLTVPTGYEITKCTWSGDVTPGYGDTSNECQYDTLTTTGVGPSKDTYGEKDVYLTLFYRHTASGFTDHIIRKYPFKVFFNKTGDDDGECVWWNLSSNCEPNWFEYWKDDGAVTQLSLPAVVYHSGLGGYGSYLPSSNQIEIGPLAAETHYPGGIVVPAVVDQCPGGTFGGATGIDAVAEVIEHEVRHQWVYLNWQTGGIWVGLLDSDQGVPDASYDDNLPDLFESSTTQTLTNNVDSCNLATYKSDDQQFYGDNEFYAMTYSDGKTGVAAKDWANPGKQTATSFFESVFMAINGSGMAFTSGPVASPEISSLDRYAMMWGKLASPAAKFPVVSGLIETGNLWIDRADDGVETPTGIQTLPALGVLTGFYADAGYDSDGDLFFNSIQLSTGVTIYEESTYHLYGWLENSGGTEIAFARTSGVLEPGSHFIQLYFNGLPIQAGGLDGPYTISRVKLTVGDSEIEVDSETDVHVTTAYVLSQFDPPDIKISGNYVEYTTDLDVDGLYDSLVIKPEVSVLTPGTYTIIGELYSSTRAIGIASKTVELPAGVSEIDLEFDGGRIFQNRLSGNYKLRALRVLDSSGNRKDIIYNAYSTVYYNSSEFEHGGITFASSSYYDRGIDIDRDGDYDYLRLTFSISSIVAGDFRIDGAVSNSQGKNISTRSKTVHLNVGLTEVTLDFIGGDIYKSGINGPYYFTGLTLIDQSGNVQDAHRLAYTSRTYAYNEFSKPLVELNGAISDGGGLDVDQDGLYEYLLITIPIMPNEDGVLMYSAFLSDNLGQTIGWVEGNSRVEEGVPIMLEFTFNGNNIYQNHYDGPYTLENLLIYLTADPNQRIRMLEALITNPYSYFQFDDFELYLQALFR